MIRAIVCKWTAPTGIDVTAYRLWRSVNTGARHLIVTVAPTAPLRHADRNIRTGDTYHYFVAAIGKDGTRVARSNVASVHVARPAQAISFNCVVIIDNATTHARCHWAATTRATAVRYVLWRSVDGGPRQVVYRTGIAGARSFTDTTVKAEAFSNQAKFGELGGDFAKESNELVRVVSSGGDASAVIQTDESGTVWAFDALTGKVIYRTVDALRKRGVEFQDTPAAYYEGVDARVAGHQESLSELEKRSVLIDGSAAAGILLQIFTKNAIGPIFFEIIQRKGNDGFGEGNFQALFESIELDQKRRGVI